jgi:TolA-binding protein
MAKSKCTLLGVVERIEPSGMVVLDNGTRSNTKAQIGDTLKRDTQTGDIIVVKATETKGAGGQAGQIKELNSKVEELEGIIETKDADIVALNDEIVALKEELTTFKEPKTSEAGGDE